ncbi:krueppel-like factor 2, partial [Nephila pilipes]
MMLRKIARCKFENVFKRPSFFARFAHYPMSYVAGMIFHWIAQSDISYINSDVPMGPNKISDAWRSFQVLCSAALKRNKEKIGGSGRPIEVAMVRYGKLYVLGAMDRRTSRTFLQAFPAEMGQANTIYYTLHSWIAPGSSIIINATELFKMQRVYKEYRYHNVPCLSEKNNGYHVRNITNYLIKHISNMFGHLKADFMRQEIMQGYLEELMWREKFGKKPQQAFSWIMNEIFFNERRMKYGGHGQEKMDLLCVPVQLKELRVVLNRIPNAVLKYYNIELP